MQLIIKALLLLFFFGIGGCVTPSQPQVMEVVKTGRPPQHFPAQHDDAELLIYYGWPSLINWVTSIDEAAEQFGRFRYVVLGEGIDDPDHGDHENTKQIVAHPATADTLFFGYITAGVTTRNIPLPNLIKHIEYWMATGVDGVFIDEFGYDFGVTRERQNALVAKVHSLNGVVVANGWMPAEVFGSDPHGQFNPKGMPTELTAKDYYLSESFYYMRGQVSNKQHRLDKAKVLKRFQQEIGFGVLAVTTADVVTPYDPKVLTNTCREARKWGYIACGWGDYAFAATSNKIAVSP